MQQVSGAAVVVAEVLTSSGRAASVDFRVSPSSVEVWHHGRRHGVLDRRELAEWLAAPEGKLVAGDARLHIDRLIDRDDGRVAVTLPDVTGWALSPGEQARLKHEVAGELNLSGSLGEAGAGTR